MANTTKSSFGIGRGKVRRVVTQDPANHHPQNKSDIVHDDSSSTSLLNTTPVSQDNANIPVHDPGDGAGILKNSRLSAEANEFYPRNYKADTSKVPGDMPVDQERTLPPDLVAGRLLEIVNSITVEPGTYENEVQPFLRSSSSALSDLCILGSVLNIIIEQSVVQPNFRYNGARLCNDLNEFLLTSNPQFRSFLLNRCKEEVDLAVKCFDSDPARLQGVVCFLAELYIQLELKPGTKSRITVLKDALFDLLGQLVSSPIPDNIKCTCMTLKLAGYALDQDDSTTMDELIQSLHKVTDLPGTNANIKAMIENIKQLRLTSWGMNIVTEHIVEETEPVFIGPDGLVLTHEESEFIQENLSSEGEYFEEGLWVNGSPCEYDCDGEMNEEEEAAYEEFLKMSEKR